MKTIAKRIEAIKTILAQVETLRKENSDAIDEYRKASKNVHIPTLNEDLSNFDEWRQERAKLDPYNDAILETGKKKDAAVASAKKQIKALAKAMGFKIEMSRDYNFLFLYEDIFDTLQYRYNKMVSILHPNDDNDALVWTDEIKIVK